MTPRDAFEAVKRCIERHTGSLIRVSLGYCPAAEEDHARVWRYHAHVMHIPGIICIVRDFRHLPDEHKFGILLHELGHLYTDSEHDADADLWVHEALGIDIDYVDTLQWVDLADLE